MFSLHKRMISSLFLFLSFISVLPSCGGGGGGSADDGNPASVTIQVSPRKIDSGDRVTLSIHLREIRATDFNGLIVKVLTPSTLGYIEDSATLELPESTDFTFAPRIVLADEAKYFLFYIDTALVELNNPQAEITFLLEGRRRLEESTISVDVDVTDSDDRDTFRTRNPQFTPLSTATIEVIDS
ncbi:hypothetical protein MRY87_05410 [bacterium]|nr:hypothetical protein [bacterium]